MPAVSTYLLTYLWMSVLKTYKTMPSLSSYSDNFVHETDSSAKKCSKHSLHGDSPIDPTKGRPQYYAHWSMDIELFKAGRRPYHPLPSTISISNMTNGRPWTILASTGRMHEWTESVKKTQTDASERQDKPSTCSRCTEHTPGAVYVIHPRITSFSIHGH